MGARNPLTTGSTDCLQPAKCHPGQGRRVASASTFVLACLPPTYLTQSWQKCQA